MSKHDINLTEQQKQKKEAKLKELHRAAKLGQKAYSRGESTLIENDTALDRFFSNIAQSTTT